jgi:SAM-dependent methyltransferase
MLMTAATLLEKVERKYRSEGVVGIIRALRRRMPSARQVRREIPVRSAGLICRLVKGKVGLEIGGPSEHVFSRKGMVPLYPIVGRLDSCNFSDRTIWEGTLEEGWTFRYDPGREPGRQIICEASDLKEIPSGAYDFCLSSHAIEHMANPLRCLQEWLRVTKEGGSLVLVVPHRDGTFDRRRPITSLAHLVEDYQRGVDEDDLSHVDEIARLHDDPAWPITDFEAAREHLRSTNYRERKIHHHVFSTPSFVEMLNHAGLQLLAVEAVQPCHIIAIGRRLPAGQVPKNQAFLDRHAAYRRRSPFPTDQS